MVVRTHLLEQINNCCSDVKVNIWLFQSHYVGSIPIYSSMGMTEQELKEAFVKLYKDLDRILGRENLSVYKIAELELLLYSLYPTYSKLIS